MLALFLGSLASAARLEDYSNSIVNQFATTHANLTAGQQKCALITYSIDESGSMSTEHAFLGPATRAIVDALIDGSVNTYLCVTGFGAGNPAPRVPSGGACRAVSKTAGDVEGMFGGLVLNGGTEDGYAGLEFATDQGNTFTSTLGGVCDAIVKMAVLVTDEDRDNYNGNSFTEASTNAKLTAGSYVTNVLLSVSINFGGGVNLGTRTPDSKTFVQNVASFDEVFGTPITWTEAGAGGGTPAADYKSLSDTHGGVMWDLQILRNGGDEGSAFAAAYEKVKAEEIITRPGCEIDQTCNTNGDPHVLTFGKQKFTYSGIGEHVLSEWGSNKITSCFFAVEGRAHSLQKSASFSCGATTVVIQASQQSKYHERKIQTHFVNSETHALLEADSIGEFSHCDVWAREASCQCQQGSHMTMTAKTMRYKGNNYLDLSITRKQPEAISFLETTQVQGGLCQSPLRSASNVFLVGPNKAKACASPSVRFPEVLLEAKEGHAAAFDGSCGPKSWHLRKGPISLIAAKHEAIGACDNLE